MGENWPQWRGPHGDANFAREGNRHGLECFSVTLKFRTPLRGRAEHTGSVGRQNLCVLGRQRRFGLDLH